MVPSSPLAARPLASTMHKSAGAGPGSRICSEATRWGQQQRQNHHVQAVPTKHNSRWRQRAAPPWQHHVLLLSNSNAAAATAASSISSPSCNRSSMLYIASSPAAAHLLHRLQHVQREAQQRGGMVFVSLCHPCADHEAVRAAVQLVHLGQAGEGEWEWRMRCNWAGRQLSGGETERSGSQCSAGLENIRQPVQCRFGSAGTNG